MRTRLIFLLVIFSFLVTPSISLAYSPPGVNPPQTSGQWTTNGTSIVLFYDSQLLNQPQPVPSGSLYHYDTVYMQWTNGNSQYPATIRVQQFVSEYVNQSVKNGNVTTYQMVLTHSQVQWSNQTVNFTLRSVGTVAIDLPSTQIAKQVQISVDGANFTFIHKSIPPVNVMPFSNSPLETWLLALLLITLVIFFSFTFAVMAVRKVKYVPPVGAATWAIVGVSITAAILLFVYAFYFDLPYVPWFGYLLPVGAVAFFAFLEKLPGLMQNVESWYTWGVRASGNPDMPTVHRKRFYAVPYPPKKGFRFPDDEQYYGFIKIDPDSRLEAFKRLFGIVMPITIKKGPKPWFFDFGPVDDFRLEDRRLYLVDATTVKAYDILEESKLFGSDLSKAEKKEKKRKRFEWAKKQGYTTRFHIPVAGHHYEKIAKFIQGYEVVSGLGKALDEIKDYVSTLEVEHDIGFIVDSAKRYDIMAIEFAKKMHPEDPRIKALLEEEKKAKDSGKKKEAENDNK